MPTRPPGAKPLKIDVSQLTTCGVKPDGSAVELGFVDAQGARTTLSLPFAHAQSLAMTLPRLLTEALKRISGDAHARYVFPLGDWRIEASQDENCVITTFSTPAGFEVSFGMPMEACRGLGWALGNEAEQQAGSIAAPGAGRPARIN